ncbi:hypothetical protein Pint_07080 [Pistacia integerrima]|uniref:Uncharacterized protein n=1 Tax=Pistacia integerrima TaxID=434235 RepID=A0ACC0XVU9_9ROSI|nr:hypothetical protein Pint_07080 [Pistacia integerrima]
MIFLYLPHEVVESILSKGTTLREYMKEVENDLRQVELDSIQDYIKESDNLVSLHDQIHDGDAILSQMETLLSGFQVNVSLSFLVVLSEIGSINSDIKILQEKSMDMGLKVAESKLAKFVEDSIIPPRMVDIIVEGEVMERINNVICLLTEIVIKSKVSIAMSVLATLWVNEEYMRTLEILSKKLKFVEVDLVVKTSKALKDVQLELEKLWQKAVSKVSDSIVQKLYALRKPRTNIQILQQNVWFMGEQSQISMDIDNIISVTLENYLDLQMKPEDGKEARQHYQSQDQWVQGVLKEESHGSSFSRYELAKETTTVKRVLFLEESGGNSHLLLSILIKHLVHKNVAKQSHVQIHNVDIATQLTQNAKLHASVAIIGAITDLIKQLQKCLQNAAELSNAVDDMAKWNADLQYALENCISQLSKKVGDAGPNLDMMSGLLENISNNTLIARATISAVHRTAQIVSSIPKISYYKKASAFANVLFHQLLLAMAHPDHETRVGAHSVFSVVLMSSLVSPWSDQGKDTSQAVSSILPVSTSQKVRSGSFSFQDEGRRIAGGKSDIQPHGLSSVFSACFFTSVHLFGPRRHKSTPREVNGYGSEAEESQGMVSIGEVLCPRRFCCYLNLNGGYDGC